MSSLNQHVIKHKLGLLNLAAELGNVSKACRVMGLSRDRFYRYQTAKAEGGIEALFDANRRKPNIKNRVDEAIEAAVVAYTLEQPSHGQVRASNELRQGMGILRMLTDRGTEYCGKAETHDYQLYLALNGIEHTKTRAASPQTNGICERFHKTILQEFYQITFRRKLYLTLEELQHDLDEWIDYYNHRRTHQGKVCCGRTPMQTMIEGKEAWQEKVNNLN